MVVESRLATHRHFDRAQQPTVISTEHNSPLSFQPSRASGEIYQNSLHPRNSLKDLLGSTIHAHDFKDPGYPYQLMIDLLVKMDWAGWILLENSSKVPDRVKAIIEQRQIWQRMLENSLAG